MLNFNLMRKYQTNPSRDILQISFSSLKVMKGKEKLTYRLEETKGEI
jgi:hypothetical protein